MPTVHATVKLPFATGLPRDVAENIFMFDGTGSLEDIGTYWSTRLASFYNATHGAGYALGNYLGNTVSRATDACLIEYRQLTIATGDLSPLLDQSAFTMSDAGPSTDLPLECASCLSYRVSRWSGTVSQRRLQGRIYIGPLNTAAVTEPLTVPQVAGALRQVMADGAVYLTTAGYGGGGGEPGTGDWVLYSRAGRRVDPIVNGWIDDEFDTQRRRGEDATTRTTWNRP